jgi:hypothetical protein
MRWNVLGGRIAVILNGELCNKKETIAYMANRQAKIHGNQPKTVSAVGGDI